ncbi:MAG: MATE family efflux transporter [Polymorphobacter sp.]
MHTVAAPSEDIPVALKPLLRLAAPVILSRLGIMAMGLTDTIVVGRHSATELGYHALGWAPTAIVLTTSIGLLTGVQVMTSQAIGEGRAGATGAILRRGLVYSFWVGVLAFLVLAGLGGPLMHNIGLSTDLADGSTPVLQLFALSLVPILIADTGIFWLEAHGRPVRGMLAMWAANVVNLGLNLWLVPGNSPFAVSGAVASAWATFGARVALLVFVAALIIAWPASRGLGVFTRAPRDPAAAADMRRIGYGASVSHFVETSAFAGMSIYAGWLGVTAVATWAIVLNVAALIFMVPLGLAVATSVLVGRSWGADDLPAVRRAGLLGFGVTFVVTLFICAVVGFGAERIANAYTLDAAVRAATTTALLLSCLFFVADGLQVVAAQALRARGDVWVPSLTHSISYLLVMLPLGYYLALPAGLGVPGIVWAVIIASLCAAGLLLTRFFWTARGLHHG